jgi:cytochrome c oxidase cbb3-type subunit 3
MARHRYLLNGLTLVVAATASLTSPRAETAQETYRLYCVQCHGTQGNGGGINNTHGGLAVSPRDHTNADEMAKLSNEELRLAIAEGGDAVQKSELMPGWKYTLTEQEISELVVHLRELCRCEENK